MHFLVKKLVFWGLLLSVSLVLTACGDPASITPDTSPKVTVVIVNPVSSGNNTTAARTATTAATSTGVTGTTAPGISTTVSATTAAATPAKLNLPGRLVFESENQIFVMNADGTDRRKIADGRSPLLSPDSRRVAYISLPPKPETVTPGNFPDVNIVSANLDGSDKQTHCSISGNAQIDLLRWSPRGRFVAINAGQNVIGNVYLCNMPDRKLGDPVRTTQGAVGTVYDWAPSGEYAIWQSPSVATTEWNLFYGDPDKGGADAVKITNGENRFDKVSPLKYYFSARFSPDGKTLAVAGTKLFLLSTPGQKSPLEGKSFEVADNSNTGTPQPYRVAWSPDGKAIAIADLNSRTLKVLDIATGNLTKVADNVSAVDWTRPVSS